ncbi:hypothetical protein ABEB36_013646 [Hypothenemus hampei]|uniref:ZSWIM3 N-terminal domain-containing protein n=1 Tax=Hypothenemus hampei TaxID=57062 RepID=A0ABD1E580_HYPHA
MEKVVIGGQFDTYEDFVEALNLYCNANYVNFYKREARTITAARKKTDRFLNPKLKYYQLKYSCIKGGKMFKSTGNGQRHTSTFKDGCDAYITLRAFKCGNKLQIIDMKTEHTHKISKQLFDHLPQQRRLPEDIKSEIAHLTKLKTNRKQIKCYIQEKCNKIILLKDIHNMVKKSKATETPEMMLQSAIKKLQTTYRCLTKSTLLDYCGNHVLEKFEKMYINVYRPDLPLANIFNFLALPVIPEVAVNFLILNGTPHF